MSLQVSVSYLDEFCLRISVDRLERKNILLVVERSFINDLTGASAGSFPECGGLPNLTHCSGSPPSVSSGPAKQDTGHQLKTATNLSLEEARILLHKFEVIFLNVAQIQEFEETFSKGIYEVERTHI